MEEEREKKGFKALLPVAALAVIAFIILQLKDSVTDLGSPTVGFGALNFGKFLVEISWLLLGVALVATFLMEWPRRAKLERAQLVVVILATVVVAVVLLPRAAFLIFMGIALTLELGITGNLDLKKTARWSLRTVAGVMTLAFIYLTYQFITSDFTNSYVWQFSSRTLALQYRISAVWAGQEGTWLMWAWLIIVSSLYVSERQGWGDSFVRKTQLITLLAGLFFTHMAFLVSPFDQIYGVNPGLTPEFVKSDLPGNGLNPLLQDPWMAIHPPLVFLGYAGVTIPLAAAIIFLFTHDKRWEAFARPWNRFAWFFLTLGIAVGGYWSYKVLGWGGYWAWDPVETSSFIPWLTVSGLMHGAVMYRRKQTFDFLGPFLAVASFILVVYATFITRSGLWESVHAFAETTAGPWLAMLILNTIFVYLVLVADYVRSKKDENGASKTAREVITAFIMAEILVLLYMRLFGEGGILIHTGMYIPTIALTAILAAVMRVRRLGGLKTESEEETEIPVPNETEEEPAESLEVEAQSAAAAPEEEEEKEFHLISYDNLFYVTVILFILLAVVSFWGITFPMVEQLRTGGKISVGIEFFNRWSFPLTVALFATLALCFSFYRVKKNHLLGALGITGVVSLASMVISPAGKFIYPSFFGGQSISKWYWSYMDITMPLLILTTIIVAIKAKGGIDRRKIRTVGFAAIHLGAIFTLTGAMFSGAYSEEFHQNYIYPMELDVPRDIGRGYSIALRGVDQVQTVDGWWATQTVVEIFKDGRPQSVGVAESIDDRVHGRVTHVYIQRGLFDDIYVIFQGASQMQGGLVIPLAVKVVPGVTILWIGIILLAIGIIPAWFKDKEGRGFVLQEGEFEESLEGPEDQVELGTGEEEPVEAEEEEEKPKEEKNKRSFLEKSLKDLEENYKEGLVDRETYRNLKKQYKKSLGEIEEKK